MKLHLACGSLRKEGFLNVDLIKTEAVDEVIDLLDLPLPWLDNSIEEIYCAHFLEHIDTCGFEGDALIRFLNEIYRILTPGGKAVFVCPYYTSIVAWQDPTHRRAISEVTFQYFNQQYLRENNISHYPITADFSIEVEYEYLPHLASLDEPSLNHARKHFFNSVNVITATLRKL